MWLLFFLLIAVDFVAETEVQGFFLTRLTPSFVQRIPTGKSSNNFQQSSIGHTTLSAGNLDTGITLSVLTDFTADGAYLNTAVATWLDKEYIPQDIHHKIGEKVEIVYIDQRKSGVEDLGEMLMEVGTALERFRMDDAFVNAWDIANKVTELLMLRMDMETCGCDGKIIDNKASDDKGIIPVVQKPLEMDPKSLATCARILKTEFSRYKLLKEFLEGDLPWDVIHAPVALVLGFRVSDDMINHSNDFAPIGWENLHQSPNFADSANTLLVDKMRSDLPDDDAATDMVIESMLGMEIHKQIVATKDTDGLHRIFIAKWLYINGFLNEVFPAQEKFVPPHREV